MKTASRRPQEAEIPSTPEESERHGGLVEMEAPVTNESDANNDNTA